MAEPSRITSSANFSTGQGIIEIVTLVSGGSVPSSLSIFDSHAESGTHGRRIYDLAAVTADSKVTPVLGIPVIWGCFGSISGANSIATITRR